jgi:hypothetical protein
MLNVTQQAMHTLSQLHACLLSMLYYDGWCVANPSSAVPRSCDQLTCREDAQPELILACDIEHRVLPRMNNLIVLLRNEVSNTFQMHLDLDVFLVS